MQTFPEQISSMTRAPIEAQLELFGSLAMASVENAGRLAQFQIDATRAAVDHTCEAWRQLLAAGPQNLFAAMSQVQSNMAETARSAFTPAHAPPAEDRQSSMADAPSAPSHEDQPAAAHSAFSAGTAPAATDPHAPQPPAHRTPIAEAASQVAADGSSSTQIASAPVREEGPVSLPKVQPLDATPPRPAHSHGVRQRKGLPRK